MATADGVPPIDTMKNPLIKIEWSEDEVEMEPTGASYETNDRSAVFSDDGSDNTMNTTTNDSVVELEETAISTGTAYMSRPDPNVTRTAFIILIGETVKRMGGVGMFKAIYTNLKLWFDFPVTCQFYFTFRATISRAPFLMNNFKGRVRGQGFPKKSYQFALIEERYANFRALHGEPEIRECVEIVKWAFTCDRDGRQPTTDHPGAGEFDLTQSPAIPYANDGRSMRKSTRRQLEELCVKCLLNELDGAASLSEISAAVNARLNHSENPRLLEQRVRYALERGPFQKFRQPGGYFVLYRSVRVEKTTENQSTPGHISDEFPTRDAQDSEKELEHQRIVAELRGTVELLERKLAEAKKKLEEAKPDEAQQRLAQWLTFTPENGRLEINMDQGGPIRQLVGTSASARVAMSTMNGVSTIGARLRNEQSKFKPEWSDDETKLKLHVVVAQNEIDRLLQI